jgi:hypothetical protein
LATGPSDYTIIGAVLAVSIAIILLSGLALYVAFRVRDTLKDERGRGARAAKVAFLIGLLFLSGGVFYFFASGFNSTGATPATSTTSSTKTTTETTTTTGTAPTTPTTSTASTTSLQTTTTTTTSAATTTPSSGPVTMSFTCPTPETASSVHTCTVTMVNQGATTYQSATLVSSGDFTQFVFQAGTCSETVNGASASCSVPTSGEVAVGNLAPGTTVVTFDVTAPSTSGQKTCSLTLDAPGMPASVTSNYTIQVSNRP